MWGGMSVGTPYLTLLPGTAPRQLHRQDLRPLGVGGAVLLYRLHRPDGEQYGRRRRRDRDVEVEAARDGALRGQVKSGVGVSGVITSQER